MVQFIHCYHENAEFVSMGKEFQNSVTQKQENLPGRKQKVVCSSVDQAMSYNTADKQVSKLQPRIQLEKVGNAHTRGGSAS